MRRRYGVVSFERSWEEYRRGFGGLLDEFWLGNEVVHYMTSLRKYSLHLQLVTPGGRHRRRRVDWNIFSLGPENDGYRLNIGGRVYATYRECKHSHECWTMQNMYSSAHVHNCFSYLIELETHFISKTVQHLYYKRGDPYICSEKAPVPEGSGSPRLYCRKGTSIDRVYVVFGARVYLGFFTIPQKRIPVGVRWR